MVTRPLNFDPSDPSRRLGHCQDTADLRRQEAEDRALDKAGELRGHLELFAEAVTTPAVLERLPEVPPVQMAAAPRPSRWEGSE